MSTNQIQQQQTSIINTLGEEIIRIITPVSICMFLVVTLVSTFNLNPSFSSSSSSSSSSIATIANIAYNETTNDSLWDKFVGSLLNSLVFVVVVTIITFFLVFLFYVGCTKLLKLYMGLSAFVVLLFMGGQIGVMLVKKLSLGVDVVVFLWGLVNFAVVGVLAVFMMAKMPILVTQCYMVVIGMLVAYWFTFLPEWTTWMLLVSMALYDLAAVLLPVGPLRLLVELAMSRDEDIPALVYEARPVNVDELNGEGPRRHWRGGRGVVDEQNVGPSYGVGLDTSPNLGVMLRNESGRSERDLVNVEEGRVQNRDQEIYMPLLEQRVNVDHNAQEMLNPDEGMTLEGIGLGSSGAIKLGLGDFIFYSVLVGRAAMYDLMTVYACYLAIIAGLGITLMLLAVYQKALPALPMSIMLGVMFYVLTRVLLEEFVVQCSLNFVMF